jgi:RNA polymerase sigma-70 factor, ECF subfamily
LEDFEVIQKIRTGDISAYSIIMEKYHHPLLNFIYSIVFNADIVEDIGQEVFISAYKSIENFDEKQGVPFSAWLFIIARNKCFSEMRKMKRDKQNLRLDDFEHVMDNNTSGDIDVVEQERLKILSESVSQLPEPYKSALNESIRGLANREIARKFQISLGTVKSRLSRARARLKEIITQKYGENPHENI